MARLKGRPASPLLLYIRGQGHPRTHKLIIDLSQPCAVPPSTIIHLGHTVVVLRRSPATVASSTSSHAVVLTKLFPELYWIVSSRDVTELNVC